MTFFEKASPALKDTLLSLYRATKPRAIDQRLYEFGAVEYHVQSSGTDRDRVVYLSMSALILSRDVTAARGPGSVVQIVERICPDAIDIVKPPKEGYQLTLRLDFDRIPGGKDSLKIIGEISALRATILIHWLKDVLRNVKYHGIISPIKLEHNPKEPFFIVGLPGKISCVFPMRFREDTDIVVAIALFQGLTDLSSSEKWSRAPACTWSPIPPPELMGESLEDLSTNGGFVSFEISPRHLKGKRMDKTVWNLLNFHTLVKHYVKATRGFLQRRMRNRLNNLVEVLHPTGYEGDQDDVAVEPLGCGCLGNIVGVQRRKGSRSKRGGSCSSAKSLRTRMKVVAGRVRINGFRRFRHRWLRLPRLHSADFKYRKVALSMAHA
ncbi:hypothetical protein MLD38_018129 [Melastoma candidum]|uniref:Uncharacterized protein n=1 Tax=Melastoma candidum TaxID=119954 RepID=A0ACB9QSW3_9MYRT|nr:hypothetical protein MLD38_018129 [Melastoma candidum]